MGPTNQIKTRQRREPKKENVKPKGAKCPRAIEAWVAPPIWPGRGHSREQTDTGQPQ